MESGSDIKKYSDLDNYVNFVSSNKKSLSKGTIDQFIEILKDQIFVMSSESDEKLQHKDEWVALKAKIITEIGNSSRLSRVKNKIVKKVSSFFREDVGRTIERYNNAKIAYGNKKDLLPTFSGKLEERRTGKKIEKPKVAFGFQYVKELSQPIESQEVSETIDLSESVDKILFMDGLKNNISDKFNNQFYSVRDKDELIKNALAVIDRDYSFFIDDLADIYDESVDNNDSTSLYELFKSKALELKNECFENEKKNYELKYLNRGLTKEEKEQYSSLGEDSVEIKIKEKFNNDIEELNFILNLIYKEALKTVKNLE